MIQRSAIFFIAMSLTSSMQSMYNNHINALHNVNNPLEFSDHALKKMNRRHITPQEIENVLFTGNQGHKQPHGRTAFFEKGNIANPLKVVLIMCHDKNMVVTAFRQNRHACTLRRYFVTKAYKISRMVMYKNK